MKHNTLPFTLALLFCLLWGAACALAEPEWMYPVSIETLRDPQDVLRLVNRDHLLDAAYPDQEIEMYRLVDVTVPVTKGTHVLRQVANDALAELFAAAERAGYSLYVGSSYRNYRTQEVIHYNRVQRMGYDDGYSQIAGASEHQMGLAADVVSWAYRDSFQESFGETLEGIPFTDEEAMLHRIADRCHDRCRCGEHQSTRAEDNKDRNGPYDLA